MDELINGSKTSQLTQRDGEDGISIDIPQQKKSDNLKKEKLDVLKERNQCYRY